ncbi:two pore domain potassium channel family protein [Desulfosporosinus hippei]|uniref:Ion channel n=1 Tax=Desulfosporosinus hippei DSM 8344 TaxID=1121419 RepID=A0A1G7U8N2_9FIRM|nr:two pore domain potassium channel family protein [Desulfosporosinus hippei]SDG43748.1 hypothetical protein SAMN05443529_10358 [Desulfosporosinus hippei DSM 8344]
MAQSKTQPPQNPPYFMPYPLNPNSRIYKPSGTHSSPTVCAPLLRPIPGFTPGYWELLTPAFGGAAVAFFLSLFIEGKKEKKNDNNPYEGILLKISLIGYSVFALAAAYYAITKVVKESRPSYNHLFTPIAIALVGVILLFTSEYLLLYRYLPSSFEGKVGDDLCVQYFSFLYFSSTTIATGTLGDIQPNNLTARALITIEIMFYVFVMATALPLLLVEKVN